MGTNIDSLRSELNNYLSSLIAHNQILNEEFSDLSRNFVAVNDSYEGRAAEAFKNSWMTTAQWFNEYINETTLLIQFLQERISCLEQEKID